MADRWLAPEHPFPARVELPTGEHMRPIRAADVALDYPAVMGSRASLWERYGEAWGWPPETMTFEQDRADLAHHEREMVTRESFNYAIFDRDETRLLGCVYLDPPPAGCDGDCAVLASWWVVDDCRETPLSQALDEFVPRWLTSAWPFTQVREGP